MSNNYSGAGAGASPVIAGSPALQATSSRDHSPSPRLRSFYPMPTLQQINTATSQSFHVIPASARSTSSVSPSPYLSSVQCSPSAFLNQPYTNLPNPAPLELPDAIVGSPPNGSNAPSSSRSEGLMRKLSHGAKNATHRLRRKASSSNQSRRDASSGPVARRRSDSKTINSNSFMSESEPYGPDLSNGLGLNYPSGFHDDITSLSDIPLADTRAEIVAPYVPDELVAGCLLTKSTRKKRQEKLFYIDKEGSRVFWNGNVITKSFQIDNIKSIRIGADAASNWQGIKGEDFNIDCCFTINFAQSEQSNEVKSLHLIAQSKRDLNLWVDTLEACSKHREELMTEMLGTERQSVLRAHWDSELLKQSTHEGRPMQMGLDITSIAGLCRKLHIHCSKSVIKSGFDAVDVHKVGWLDFEQFRRFVSQLRARHDFKPIFETLKATDCQGITRERFFQFLTESQRLDMSTDAVWNTWEAKIENLLVTSACCRESEHRNQHIDFDAFTSFMVSKDCRIYSSADKMRGPLNRPLNEYFISSSHNTYLTGRQVNGTSSVEAYVTALRRGCRSVEIDCWDGDNDNPRVTHGFTKTTSVNFIDVIHAINGCAFDASRYPVILSLEVHCNPIQQARMVQIMEDIFQDRLLLHLLADRSSTLPSPEELKEKILVKVKATEAYPNLFLPIPTDTSTTARKRSTSSPYRRPGPLQTSSSYQQSNLTLSTQAMMSPPESVYSPTDRSMTTTSASSEDDSDGPNISPVASEPSSRPRVKTSKIIPRLASLGTYLQGYSLRNYRDLTFQQFNHIFSLNENTAMALCSNPETKGLFEDHNLKYMCRVYPKNFRVNSSNFDPNTFWRRGVQMVALNCQTYDTHMQMMQAMFAAGSDQSGYVLKPEYLRKPRRSTGAIEYRHKLPRFKIKFSVKVISAQQLPRLASMSRNDSIDPFIEVQMFSAEDKARGIANGTGGKESSSTNGYHGIGSPYSRRTRMVRDNGYNPQFNDLIELCLETKYPELVFVRFIVYQAGKNSKQLAVFTAKLDSLQTGYRHIPLYNSHGEELIFSTLFCQIEKGGPELMASSLQDLADHTPRQRSFRSMLTRNMSSERGRERTLTLEDQRRARQLTLNDEIERREGRVGRP